MKNAMNEGRKKPLLFCSFKVTALLMIYRQPERSWELVDENLNTEYWIWNCGTKPRSIYKKKQMSN